MNSLTECQMMSARASPSTRESTVSTDSAWASTIKGRCAGPTGSCRTDVDQGAVARDGVMLSLASVIKPKEPSEPHSTRLTSSVSVSGLIEVLEIVTGQKTVELGEGGLDVGAALTADAIEGAIDLPSRLSRASLSARRAPVTGSVAMRSPFSSTALRPST